jgi:hypothetical protein
MIIDYNDTEMKLKKKVPAVPGVSLVILLLVLDS